MGGYSSRGKKFFISGLVFAALGFLLVRLIGRAVASSDEPEDEIGNQSRQISFVTDEERYPPFVNKDIEAVHIAGGLNSRQGRQVVIIGVSKTEFQTSDTFAIARCDASDVWRPAIIKGRPVTFIAPKGDMIAVALYVDVGDQCLALGTLDKTHFTAYKSTQVLALTTDKALASEYSDVPLGIWR